jgi:hypothetical protein
MLTGKHACSEVGHRCIVLLVHALGCQTSQPRCSITRWQHAHLAPLPSSGVESLSVPRMTVRMARSARWHLLGWPRSQGFAQHENLLASFLQLP